jgi:hypothetical protein
MASVCLLKMEASAMRETSLTASSKAMASASTPTGTCMWVIGKTMLNRARA